MGAAQLLTAGSAPPHRPPAPPTTQHHTPSWGWLLAFGLARGYRALLLTLLVAALLPTLWSWPGFVVRSGSMEPKISVGDVVVGGPLDERHPLRAGRIILFTREGASETTVHRIVSVEDDGRFTTAGDANPSTDTTPVSPDQIEGQVRMVVPFVGLPFLWLQQGELVLLALWGAVTAAALTAAREPGRRRREGPGPWLVPPVAAAVLVPVVMPWLVHAVSDSSGPTADAGFTARTATRQNTWRPANPLLQRYTAAVLADNPLGFYLLDEASGSVAYDRSKYAWHAGYGAVAAYRAPGALPRNPGYSVRLGGGQDRLTSVGQSTSDPTNFSVEMWFKTTTTAGGKLVGFESSQNATTSTYADRHVFMRPDGRLVYGGWTPPVGTQSLLVSPAAYNDGAWHHLVLTGVVSGTGAHTARMYVDGAAVASGSATAVRDYTGWWRVGFGTLPSGAGYPATAGFEGYVDQVAGYLGQLSPTRVKAHYDAR